MLLGQVADGAGKFGGPHLVGHSEVMGANDGI